MDTSHTGLRSVPQLLYPGHQLHLSPPQNPELGLTPGPLGYGGGQSWSWHTADWWSHWEREKPVDQHHPETTSLNKLNRRWQRESWRRVVVQKTKHPNSVCVCAHVCVCLFAFRSEGYLLCSDPRFWSCRHGRMLLPERGHQEALGETCSRLWSEGGLCTPLLYSLAGAGPRANNTDTTPLRTKGNVRSFKTICTRHWIC